MDDLVPEWPLYRVNGLGFRAYRVNGLGFRVYRVYRVNGLGFRVYRVYRVNGLGFRVYRVNGLGFRAYRVNGLGALGLGIFYHKFVKPGFSVRGQSPSAPALAPLLRSSLWISN